MNVSVLNNYEDLSNKTADWIITFVNENPKAVLSFAGGSTPARTYELLIKAVREGRVDFSQATFIGLDEWVGMGREDFGSCQHFIFNEFFIPAGVKDSQIHFFDAQAQELETECKRMDDTIVRLGGIDFILLGLGVNGHLGFNEPGVSFNGFSHVIELDSVTQKVGQKYFAEPKTLTNGITLGIRNILDAKTIILLANGSHKADAVKQMLEGPVTNSFPASILQHHHNTYLFFDEEAYSKIQR